MSLCQRVRTNRAAAALTLACTLLLNAQTDAQRFPFVIPGYDAVPSATDFSYLSTAPAGADGFVRIVDGHFATNSGRLRVWGVNLCFGASFPTHDEADKVAAHLAKLGINGVRIHHHETSFSPRGLFKKDGTLDPQQVDRLDYFLAQLHRHGIYANLNMHVGRSVSQQLGLPSLGSEHYLMRDKHALHFQPEIQQAFWKYCRDYLEHVNPYRKLRRADDPAIAMIELCNENKFSEVGPGALLAAPEPYRSALIDKWNKWLVGRYRNTAALRTAWSTGKRRASRVLASSKQWTEADMGGWQLSDNQGKAPIDMAIRTEASTTIMRLTPRSVARQGWHQQLTCKSFGVDKDSMYVLRFDARADHARNVGMNVAKTVEGKWTSLGLTRGLELNEKWQRLEFRFQTPASVKEGGRLAFDLGGDQTAVELKNLELIEGGNAISVPAGQSLEQHNVVLPQDDWSIQARRDFRQFMLDTETSFYRETKRLLTDEIGVRVPITTTQANYQPVSITANVADYADMHAYWHHPIFPGRSWDGNNWTVQNETMVAFPFQDKWPRVNLLMRTPWRLHGKPFTFSEWNTGEPGFFAADAIPAAAMIAALQDWDAVFFFNYHSKSGEWDTDKILGYFDLNGQPTKTALVAALANLYRRGDLGALKQSVSVAPGLTDRVGAVALQYQVGIDPKMAPGDSFTAPAQSDLETPQQKLLQTPDSTVVWDARNPDQARVVIDTAKTKCVWGLVGRQQVQVGAWQMQFGPIQRDYAVAVATSRDGKSLSQSHSILLTLVSNGENQEMGWNAERTSVGTQWGHGPTLVNGVSVQLSIPASQTARRLYALDSQGKRVQEIPGKGYGGRTIVFNLGAQWKTLFYELSDK